MSAGVASIFSARAISSISSVALTRRSASPRKLVAQLVFGLALLFEVIVEAARPLCASCAVRVVDQPSISRSTSTCGSGKLVRRRRVFPSLRCRWRGGRATARSLRDVCARRHAGLRAFHFRKSLRELVVEGGEFERLDVVHGDREDRSLPGEIFLRIIAREDGFDRLWFRRRSCRRCRDANPGMKRSSSSSVIWPFGAAAVERHAVDLALVVERDDVAELRRPIDRDERCRALAQGVSRLRSTSSSLDWRACRARLRCLYSRRNSIAGRTSTVAFRRDGFALFRREHLHLRAVDRLELVLAYRARVDLGDDVFEGLARDRLGAVGLLEHLARHFAWRGSPAA